MEITFGQDVCGLVLVISCEGSGYFIKLKHCKGVKWTVVLSFGNVVKMEENFDVKYKDHFKLYIQVKDKIRFESALHTNRIPFHSDIIEQAGLFVDVRYFLLDVDRPLIDEIVKSNGIIASTETIHLHDIHDIQKLMRFSLIVILVLLLITVIAMVIFD